MGLLLEKKTTPKEWRILKGESIFSGLELIKGEYVERQGWERDMNDPYTFASYYFGICQDGKVLAVMRAVDGKRAGSLPMMEHTLQSSIDPRGSVELSRFVGRGVGHEELAMMYQKSLQFLFNRNYRCYAFIRRGLAQMIEDYLGISLTQIGPQKGFKNKVFIPVEFTE